MKPAYIFCVLFGLGLGVYIYGINFDNYSEAVLIQMTPVWFLPLIFGIYGFIADKLIEIVEDQKAITLRQAVLVWMGGMFGLLSFIPLFPFLFIKGKNPLVVAVLGTVVWGILLTVFIFAIFPML